MITVFKNANEAILFADNNKTLTIGVLYIEDHDDGYYFYLRDGHWRPTRFRSSLRNTIRQIKSKYKIKCGLSLKSNEWKDYPKKWIIER